MSQPNPAHNDSSADAERRMVSVRGREIACRIDGDGPPVVLLHGILSSSATWDAVFADLSRDHLVIAPDLLGHGRSAKPRGDYSIGGHANVIRDLLDVLGIECAAFVGHSLGGGVAMQLAYQYTERCARLVLVASGGLGRGVTPLLRALSSFPGVELALIPIGWAAHASAQGVSALAVDRVRFPTMTDLREALAGCSSLRERAAREAFLRTLRAVVDARGQQVSALDAPGVITEIPTMIVWGTHDPVIPVGHAHRAHRLAPTSRLEVFERSGHFPHSDDHDRFVGLLREFLGASRDSWSLAA